MNCSFRPTLHPIVSTSWCTRWLITFVIGFSALIPPLAASASTKGMFPPVTEPVKPLGHLDPSATLKDGYASLPYAPSGFIAAAVDIDADAAVRIARGRAASDVGHAVFAPLGVLPLFDADDRLVAYDMDFALAGPVDAATVVADWQEYLAGRVRESDPAKRRTLAGAFSGPHADDYWRVTVAATYDAPPVRAAGPGVSNYYALAQRLRDALAQRTGAPAPALLRAYLVGTWARAYLFEAGGRRYVVEGHEPYGYYDAEHWLAPRRASLAAGRAAIQGKVSLSALAKARDDHRARAAAFEAGLAPADQGTWLADYDVFQPLVWWGGCTPTAAAMCMTFYHNQRHGLPLVRYYAQWTDPVYGNWVCRVPDCSPDLRRFMGTDDGGGTYIGDIIPGLRDFMDSRNVGWQDGIDFVGYYLDWHFADGMAEIDAGHPFVWGLDFYPGADGNGHSVTVVGYHAESSEFFCFNTWADGPNSEVASCEGGLTDYSSGDGVRPADNPATGIALVEPLGNADANNYGCGVPVDYGTGETVQVSYDIVGNPGYYAMQVDFSLDAGRQWTNIGTGPVLPNERNQVVLPVPPNAGSQAARVRLRAIRDGVEVAADASLGNFLVPLQSPPVTYADAGAGLPGSNDSAAAWGDYDRDGDFDLVLAGSIGAKLFRNDAGALVDAGAGLPGVSDGAVAWGDYDRDGDLDLVLTGSLSTRIYRNDNGAFVQAAVTLQNLEKSTAAWGDYDNDGDLDLLVSGYSGYAIAGYVARLYRNDGATFTSVPHGLTGIGDGVAAWADYDNDGDLDLLLAGYPGAATFSRIYRNDGGAFADIGAGLPGLRYTEAAWGDYDADGDQDLVLCGHTGTAPTTRIYRNDGGAFTDIGAPLTGVANGSVAWGDADNDGDLDLLLAGYRIDGPFSAVYRNADGVFGNAGISLPAAAHGSVTWTDTDGDGLLDFLVTGDTGAGYVSALYRATGGGVGPNARPYVPRQPVVTVTGSRAVFTWEAPYDAQTPSPGLSYSLCVGTTPGGCEVVSPQTIIAGDLYSRRLLPRWDGAGQLTTWAVDLPSALGRYYWRVQAIDGAFAGSAFTSEQSFVAGTLADVYTDIGGGLAGVAHAALAWGDYDGDGDLDLLLTGATSGGSLTRLYRNDAGTFTNAGAGLPAVENGAVAWGDCDNDGDLDLALTGFGTAAATTRILRNNAGMLTDGNAGLPGVYDSAVAWGDYDNDGDLDLLLAGWTGSASLTRVYRNTSGTFADAGAVLPGVRRGSAAWGDYDHDGDLDLLLAGDTGTGYITRMYRNTLGALVDANAGLPGLSCGAVAWHPDGERLVLTGLSVGGAMTRVYRQVSGNFTIEADLLGLYDSSAAWGDYDNDGGSDLLLTGNTGLSCETMVMAPDGSGGYRDIGAGLPGVQRGTAAWGDYDRDGRLDVALAGSVGDLRRAAVYHAHGTVANTVPSAPVGLGATPGDGEVSLAWGAAADAQTPAGELHYNLRVGTTPGGSEIVSAQAGADGARRVADGGNARSLTGWRLQLPAHLHTYYWSVQAIDGALAGSAFATEQVFRVSTFDEIATTMPGLSGGSTSWADYDSDGDLDLFVAGTMDNGSRVAKLYRSSGGAVPTFIDAGAAFTGVGNATAAWADYDRDGDLDLLLAGTDAVGSKFTRLYRNGGGSSPVFTDSGVALAQTDHAIAAWGDYDNDGDPDLLLAGGVVLPSTRLYRNTGGTSPGFVEMVGANLPGLGCGSADWGDYDRDGDLDLLLTGAGGTAGSYVTRIYRNPGDGSADFTDIGAALLGVSYSSAAWGDYDNDSNLDILLAGRTGSSTCTTKVYRNGGGANPVFTDAGIALPGVANCSVAWGDRDGDGDLDIRLGGRTEAGEDITAIFANGGGTNPAFTEEVPGLPGAQYCAAAWGDLDNDGDLDLALTGLAGTTAIARVFQNPVSTVNLAPGAPAGLAATQPDPGLSRVDFSWSPATDDRTPTAGLTYNLRIGTTPGADDIVPGLAGAATGWRRVAARGNVDHRVSWSVNLPWSGTFYWSVQAIDAAYRGSAFAAEQSMTINIQRFVDIGAGLTGVYTSATAWGDYDNDGDLDLVLAGTDVVGARVTKLYRNGGGTAPTFTEVAAGLPGVTAAALAWGDYDNDGDLDLFVSGGTATVRLASIFRNSGGATPSFTDIGAGLTPVTAAGVAWGDYDNDGDLDLALTGSDTPSSRIGKVYRNSGGANPTFTDAGADLVGVQSGATAWGDYDNDGDLDLLVTGASGTSTSVARVYRNGGGATPAFTNIGAPLDGVQLSSGAWGDYDSDGDLDLLVSGYASGGVIATRIYRNSGGAAPTFADAGVALPGMWFGSLGWGDYDNDGDPDILLAGWDAAMGSLAKVLRNNGGDSPAFTDVLATIEGVNASAVAWGDYDGDGDLDLALTGAKSGGGRISTIYRNDGTVPASPPAAPANLRDSVAGAPGAQVLTLAWDAPTSGSTPTAGLSYSVRVGTAPGAANLAACPANAASGWRRVAARGDLQPATWFLRLPAGVTTYYWSVQAIGAGLDGGAFAPERSNLTIDWAGLQSPATLTVASGATTAAVYGQVRLTGLTGLAGATPGLVAELGFGPDGSDPSAAGGSWEWTPAAFSADAGENDEYVAQFALAMPGTYDYCFRFAYSNGMWVYGDLDGSSNGYAAAQAGSLFVGTASGVVDAQVTALRLHPAQPNPFNPRTTIRFDVPRAMAVKVEVFDVAGRLVRVLVDGTVAVGRHEVVWDGRAQDGGRLASGLYFCRLTADAHRETRRLTLVK